MNPTIIPPAVGVKQRARDKTDPNPLRIASDSPSARKPPWLRTRLTLSPQVSHIKNILRRHHLSSVCEEAQCPNLGECFGNGTATFMVMGDICTRRCPFCDVAHGRPLPLDDNEPYALAQAIQEMRLNYVVITSVDRDDLRDGGGAHFAQCVQQTRLHNSGITVEILVPDFRGRLERALPCLLAHPPDVMNHNLETIPRLYKAARPGADYAHSLHLLAECKRLLPTLLTKSGIMVGLGETFAEVLQVMRDLRAHQVDMLTIGQYLRPSEHHLPVEKYWHPDEFAQWASIGKEMGFTNVASGPLVRSSYHADHQHDMHKTN